MKMDNIEIKEALKEHTERIEELEKKSLQAESKIEHLCDKLDSLINSLTAWSSLITRAILTGVGTIIIGLILFVLEKHM